MTEITARFIYERDTKNTRRFMEVGDPTHIGTLYVQKSSLKKAFGGVLPETLSVTITEGLDV